LATDNRGGYRRPTKPAPVSGPGKLSRRTDGGPAKQPVRALSDAAYGEQATYRADQQGAPMAKAPGVSQGGAPAPPTDLSNVVPFGAPSQRPGEPVTAGADAGAGPGSEALGMGVGRPDPGVQYMIDLLPMFAITAALPNSTIGFRQFVRRLRAMS
jgi:hypothetical protein